VSIRATFAEEQKQRKSAEMLDFTGVFKQSADFLILAEKERFEISSISNK